MKSFRDRWKWRMSDKLIFLYDKLMTRSEQKKMKIDTKFIAYGKMRGKMYRVISRWTQVGPVAKQTKRLFVIPADTTKMIYGGIFLAKDWEVTRQKFHAYYHNSMPNCGATLKEDLYAFTESDVYPIKFKSLTELQTGRYETGSPVRCGVFIGNLGNGRITYNSTHEPRYGEKRIDKDSFISMVKENNRTKEK